MLECEFLAFLFVIIYVGAIAVLFLFAIMMLEPKTANLLRNRMEYFPAGLAFGLFFVLPIYYQINRVTFLDSLKQMLEYETNNNPKYYKWWKDRVIDIAEADGLYINKFQNWWDLLFTVGELDVYSHTLYTLYILQFLIAGLILLLVLVGVVYLTSSSEKHARQQSDFKQLSRKAQIFSKK